MDEQMKSVLSELEKTETTYTESDMEQIKILLVQKLEESMQNSKET